MRLVKLLLLLLYCAPVYAMARVQTPAHCDVSSGPSVSCTLGSNVTAGSALLLPMWGASNSTRLTFTITDSRSSNWKLGKYYLNTVTGSYRYVLFLYALNVSAGAETVTITPSSGSVYMDAQVVEYSGLATTEPFIESSSMSTNPGSSLTAMSATVASGNTDLAFSFAVRDYGAGNSWSQTAGWTTVDNYAGPTSVQLISSEQLNATSGTYSNTYTNPAGSPGVNTIGMIFTLRSATASGIAFTQSASSPSTGAGTTVTTSTRQNIQSGAFLIASSGADIAITSVSGCGATWVLACSTSATATFHKLFYAVNVSAGACTVTQTNSGSAAASNVVVAEYQGLPSTTTLQNCGTSTANPPAASAAATQTNNLIISTIVASGQGSMGGSTNGFSLREWGTNAPSGGVDLLFDKIGGAATYTNSISSLNGNPVGITATFGAPAAVTASQPVVGVQF